MTIQDRLRAAARGYMGRHGITQAEFGRRIRLSRSAVHRWLMGDRRLSPEAMERCAVVLGVRMTIERAKKNRKNCLTREAKGCNRVIDNQGASRHAPERGDESYNLSRARRIKTMQSRD